MCWAGLWCESLLNFETTVPDIMNPAHLHLLLTHLPVLGSVFGLCLLLLALLQGNQELKRTSFWVFVLAACAALPTYFTGQPAGALLLKVMPGLSPDPGDQHAEIAIVALIAAGILGAVALGGLLVYRRGKRAPGWFTCVALTLAVITTSMMVWTASLGGKIRHTEIQETESTRH